MTYPPFHPLYLFILPFLSRYFHSYFKIYNMIGKICNFMTMKREKSFAKAREKRSLEIFFNLSKKMQGTFFKASASYEHKTFITCFPLYGFTIMLTFYCKRVESMVL